MPSKLQAFEFHYIWQSMSAMLPHSAIIDRRLWLIAALIPLLFMAIYGLSGFRGLYGQDSYAYLLYSKAIYDALHGAVFSGHWHWPALYPMLGAFLSLSGLSAQWALIFVNMLALVVLFLSCAAILNRHYPKQEPLIIFYLMVFLCLSPFLLRTALSIMSECSAMACLYLCLYFACFSTHPARAIPLCFFAALACCSRYAMLLLVLVPLLYAFIRGFRKGSYVFWGIGLLLAGFILYVQFDVVRKAMGGFQAGAWLEDWSLLNLVKQDFVNEDGRQYFRLPNLLQLAYVCLHPGFLFCGAVLIFYVRRKDFDLPKAILAITACVYLLFIAGFPTQNPRLLLPAFPLMLLFLFPAFQRLTTVSWIKRFPLLIGAMALLVQLLLCIRAFAPMVKREQMEKNIAGALQRLPPERTLYSSGLDGALHVYGVRNPLKNIYLETFTTYEKNAYLLINPAELQEQWMGSKPYRNWKKMEAQCHLVKLLELEGGWVLYELR